MATQEGGGGVKRLARLNIVHCDEIWKDHIRRERASAQQRWPETWGYLINEYNKMNCVLEGLPVSSRPSSGTFSYMMKTESLKLPPIADRRFPRTTSQEIGWKSVQDGRNADMVTRYTDRPRGKCTIERRLRWPKNCI
ncbi:hypothetical protein ACF0H5_003407 [Mactra antiquata]